MKTQLTLIIAIVLLSVLSLMLLIDKYHNKRAVIHNDTLAELSIGQRLVLEHIDKYGTIHLVIEEESNEPDDVIRFVWNDDEESIPTDNSLIRIESTDKNIIYLTNK